jgi:hypothetical protein
MLELNILERDRHEAMSGEFYISRYVGELVEPLEQVSSEQ